jgi:hypothetical protein
VQSGCADQLASNGLAAIVDAAAATCLPQSPNRCAETDDAELCNHKLCRGWGFSWDAKHSVCAGRAGHGGH